MCQEDKPSGNTVHCSLSFLCPFAALLQYLLEGPQRFDRALRTPIASHLEDHFGDLFGGRPDVQRGVAMQKELVLVVEHGKRSHGTQLAFLVGDYFAGMQPPRVEERKLFRELRIELAPERVRPRALTRVTEEALRRLARHLAQLFVVHGPLITLPRSRQPDCDRRFWTIRIPAKPWTARLWGCRRRSASGPPAYPWRNGAWSHRQRTRRHA